MEKKQTNFISTELQAIIDTLERLVERFIALLLLLKKEKEKEQMFMIRHRDVENVSLLTKVIYILVIALLTVLIIFDYSTMKNFIDYIHSRFSGNFAQVVTYTGVLVFIGLEILSGVRLELQHQKIERDGDVNMGYQVVTYGLVLMSILIPSIIIYTEYQLMEDTEENYLKMVVLIIVSLVIHIVFFASVDKLLEAFTYIYFKIKQWFFKSGGIENSIRKLKPHLRKAYREYDRLLALYSALPEEDRQINHRLGEKELLLRNRLTNTFSSYEEDFVLLAPEPQINTADTTIKLNQGS